MQITKTSLGKGNYSKQLPQENALSNPSNAEISDQFSFSSGSKLSGMKKFQLAAVAVGGGAMAAVPFAGAATGAIGAAANGDDPMGVVLGAATAVTNLAASVAFLKGHTWGLAVPAALGAATWVGFGYNNAK